MGFPTKQKLDRELENQIALAGDLATRSTVWKSRPTFLEMAYNNLCNLKCVMCAKSDGEPNAVMDTELGNEFLGSVLPYVLDWMPSANSEPLLNDIDLLVRQAEEHEVWLHVISNATLLTPERYEKLSRRMHKLWISLDAATPETFEKIRVNARWDPVMANIRKVLPLALKDGVQVTFNFVLMSNNWHESAAFVSLIADLGGRICNIQELLPNSTGFAELNWSDKVSKEQIAAELERARQVAEERKIDLKIELRPPLQGRYGYDEHRFEFSAPLPDLREHYTQALNRRHPGFCQMATNYLKVTPDGDVFPCCRGPESLNMGNIKTASFDEIWNGEKYQEFRRQMLDGDYPSVCASCYVLVGNPEYQRMRREQKGARQPVEKKLS
jgi:radical SAM protein with 4Fe4S-binding SPASM domain